eukprot:scaffold1104_cov299-Prasinococcus_capsulatus_cf.AAC.23
MCRCPCRLPAAAPLRATVGRAWCNKQWFAYNNAPTPPPPGDGDEIAAGAQMRSTFTPISPVRALNSSTACEEARHAQRQGCRTERGDSQTWHVGWGPHLLGRPLGGVHQVLLQVYVGERPAGRTPAEAPRVDSDGLERVSLRLPNLERLRERRQVGDREHQVGDLGQGGRVCQPAIEEGPPRRREQRVRRALPNAVRRKAGHPVLHGGLMAHFLG